MRNHGSTRFWTRCVERNRSGARQAGDRPRSRPTGLTVKRWRDLVMEQAHAGLDMHHAKLGRDGGNIP